MPARPLTAVVTLGVFACVATVGLEAVGVLFPADDAEPGSRMEALIAGLGADTQSMVTPSRPVDLPEEATASEPVWVEPAPTASADPASSLKEVAAEATPADPPARAEPRMAAFLAMATPPGLPADSLPDEGTSPIEILSPPWQPPAQPAPQEPEPAVIVPAALTAGPEPARPNRQRLTRTDRQRSARAHAGTGTTGCPLLDWLVP